MCNPQFQYIYTSILFFLSSSRCLTFPSYNLSTPHPHTCTSIPVIQTTSLRQPISGYQGNLWMMSCGMAAVPRLTSVGRELLILSRVWPKILAPLPEPAAPVSPTPPHPLYPEHCILFSRHWNLLLNYSSPTLLYAKVILFLTKTTLYDHPRSTRTRILKLCSGRDNGGQTRTAVFARLHLGRLDSLEVPCGLPRSEAKWSICPVCDPSDQPQPFISPKCYLESRDGH